MNHAGSVKSLAGDRCSVTQYYTSIEESSSSPEAMGASGGDSVTVALNN